MHSTIRARQIVSRSDQREMQEGVTQVQIAVTQHFL